jgi:parvulin-like peptidyl-prolyl isomerase
MFRFFRKHRTLVMTSMAVCLVGLLFFGIGTTSFLPSANDVIVKVNGEKIRQSQFDRLYNQIMRQKNNAKPEERQQVTGQALNELIRQEVFAQEAKKFGIEVSDQELQLTLSGIPAFQKDGHFDPQTYVRALALNLNTTPNDFEKGHKKDLAAQRVNRWIASVVHIPDDVFEAALINRIKTETDPKKRKEMEANPEVAREELRNKELNLVFSDWLGQLNSNLKVNIVSETFRQRLNAPAGQ